MRQWTNKYISSQQGVSALRKTNRESDSNKQGKKFVLDEVELISLKQTIRLSFKGSEGTIQFRIEISTPWMRNIKSRGPKA